MPGLDVKLNFYNFDDQPLRAIASFGRVDVPHFVLFQIIDVCAERIEIIHISVVPGIYVLPIVKNFDADVALDDNLVTEFV
jgi:hypothetical protein